MTTLYYNNCHCHFILLLSISIQYKDTFLSQIHPHLAGRIVSFFSRSSFFFSLASYSAMSLVPVACKKLPVHCVKKLALGRVSSCINHAKADISVQHSFVVCQIFSNCSIHTSIESVC